jgi:hypothetical protein
LQKAELAAAQAEASAARAETDASTQVLAVNQNTAAVTTLENAVTGLKSGQASLSTTVSAVRANLQAPSNGFAPGISAVVATPVIEALVPYRVFPIGGIDPKNLHPAFYADGVGLTPYGFIKLTAIEDSSSPNGDDFPLPGFINDTPANGAPEFHLKARETRFGTNFSWHDNNPKWIVTGRIEGDFLGNFSRADNRNMSSIRSNNPAIRLAWARMDYRFDQNNTFSALFGQDWSIFGSSSLPYALEQTGFGLDFGSLFERDPQMRVGYTHRTGGVSIMPEFSLNLPGSGLVPSAANVVNQIGYGERQGPDSNRPNVEARLALQDQVDHAPGVAPAQLVFSAFNGKRTANVLAAGIPAAFQATFPRGTTASSKQDGWNVESQLPTRWFTLTNTFYSGSDLRWFMGGQLYSYFNDVAGLTSTATVASQDGSSNLVFGTSPSGQQVIAPERPVRAIGGFAQLGLPLSRIFNADPAGRNAGWSIFALYGVDQAKARDIDRAGGVRHESTMAKGMLSYKFTRSITFSFEESLYTTHANPELTLPLYRGVKSREWNDLREEGGPIFSF